MPQERDERIVALALDAGLIDPDQVEACRTLEAEADPPLSLLEILIRQGHVTRDQVVALLSAEHLPQLERCEMVEELPAGALGTSCVVEDPAQRRRYVVTVLHPSVQADAELVDRLRRDAAVAARLQHPHVVRTLGMGEEMGDAFLVREHARGASLTQLLEAKGKLETQEVVFVALACAKALEAGLARGLLHGAIGPASVLVAQDGTVGLTELGLTKPPIREVSISRTGDGIRSPHGLSPEQLDREPSLDARSDLFSLGALLYRCLTGEQPYEGDTTAEVTFAIRDGDFRPVHDVAPQAPQALGAIIEMLLQPDPDRRYQTPAELIADLEALQAGKMPEAQRAAIAAARKPKPKATAPTPQPPAQAEAEPAAGHRRTWLWISLGAVAAVALIAVTVGLATRLKAPKPPEPDEVVETDPNDPVLRARRGREEVEQAVAADASEKHKEPEKKVAAIQQTIQKLEDIERRYDGTAAAEEARKRLVPLQAEALFQTAHLFARERPNDAPAVAKRYREVVERFPETAAALKAERELDRLEGQERKAVQRELLAVRERADKLAGAERFGAALAEWDKFLGGVDSEAVRQQVLQEKIAITTKAEQAYDKAHALAQEKVRGRLFEEAKALYAGVVERFGVEPYVGRAKGEIAIIEPLLASAATRRVEAIDAAKYEFFLSRLEPSLAKARGWLLDEASAEAEKLREDLRTAQIEGYLDDYLADLALLRSLKAHAIRRLSDRARPVVVSQFSYRKAEGAADLKEWLDSQVAAADKANVVIPYRTVKVARSWDQFRPDELYKLGKLAVDAQDPHARLLLGVHCLYTGLFKTAETELRAAAAGKIDVTPYLERLKTLASTEPDERRKPEASTQEQASQLYSEARRFMEQREWDRALYRLALLRERHARQLYDVSANLDDINRRIAECKLHVAKLEMQTDLALGRRVLLTRDGLFEEWQKRFGTWTITDGVVHGEMITDPKAAGEGGGDHDAECLFSLAHPPSYELRCKVRILKGTGALLRLAGKARPNLGFWIHVKNPKLTGILHAYQGDEKPAEHLQKPFPFKLSEWQEIRATVTPATVEVAIGPTYRVTRPNPLPADPKGIVTYGFLVNPDSTADFRDFSVRVLQPQ